MTTLREAAQMALDALEHGLPIIEDFGGKEQLQIQHKAISALYEALRAALAQPEKEWKDLTSDELVAAIQSVAPIAKAKDIPIGLMKIATAVEKALKEKNNG